ncbi:MAG: VCBS repeat-containing protein [Armatimonadetes bacterium]|nr:VCBS repeat-containing protein [Armatimonadota bacterium]
MVSGSYDGPIFVFRGDGKGGFLAPQKIAGKDGKDLVLDNAVSISLADWNKDGKPDIFAGTISGPVYYIENNGNMKVGEPVRLSCDGKELSALDGGPAAVDWDNDGTLDMFLGEDDGALRYMKGVPGAIPSFKDLHVVLNQLPQVTDQENMLAKVVKTRPTLRPKPFIGDWNGDGKPDLLVGDFCLLPGPPPQLTPAQAKERDDLAKQQASLNTELEKLTKQLERDAAKKMGYADAKSVPPGKQEAFQLELATLQGADANYNRLLESITEVFTKKLPFEPPVDYHGFVWLFLKK